MYFSNHNFLNLEEILKFRDAEISSLTYLTDDHVTSTVMFLILGRSLSHKGGSFHC